jgi:hypothetical protein
MEDHQMIRRTWIARLFASAVAAIVCSGSAEAGLLPVSVTVQPEAGNFRWTYSVVLPTNMSLQSGNYFTIYDFAGYVPGSGTVTATGANTTASEWTITSNKTGVTPAGLNPTDNASTPNVTFTYSGPSIPSGQLTLGNFSLESTYGTTATGAFTAINPRAADGTSDANLTSTLVPSGKEIPSPVGTPEPGTLVLAGLGLPLVGLARSLRRKAQLATAAA